MKSVWCVGRNFAMHAKELGNALPKEPVVFLKSPACLAANHELTYPSPSDVHFECEIVGRVNGDCNGYSEFSIGLDLTLRSKQSELKAQGLPWTAAKCFPQSAVVADHWLPTMKGVIPDVTFGLFVNEELRQKARLSEALFCPKTVLLHLQNNYPLSAGDCVFLGTPAGVGPLATGDKLTAFIDEALEAHFNIRKTKL